MKQEEIAKEKIKTKRNPIVVVLGHIDHGKTTLLDYIRKSNVALKETGGITQHVGAYEIEVPKKGDFSGGKITFIDTPGHEAFSSMRSRGAKIADMALLVVAADDGVKPQTEEALKVIQDEKIPFIVVLNKMDKDSADPERAKKELGDLGVIFEEWGGKVPVSKVSAKTGDGVEELLELIVLVSDLEDLSSDLFGLAKGVVIESHLDSKRGNAATLLIRDGMVEKGNWIRAGESQVKIKILEDFKGNSIEEAKASSPVRVVGFNLIPQVGSEFQVFDSLREMEGAFENLQKKSGAAGMESFNEGVQIVPVVIKADVAGSLEALLYELKKFEKPDLRLNVLRMEVGNISEDDIKLASSGSGALAVGFRVKYDKSVVDLAERFKVSLGTFDVIYELGDWVKKEIEKVLPAEKIRKILGRAKIIKIFKKEGSKLIVGGKVEDGAIYSAKRLTLLRRGFPLAEGRLIELRQGKTEVKEVAVGTEFGAMIDVNIDPAGGDEIEVYEEEIKKRLL